jgi:hypothetical protein
VTGVIALARCELVFLYFAIFPLHKVLNNLFVPTFKTTQIKRRNFIKLGLGVGAIGVLAPSVARAGSFLAGNKLPRWRGFNLLEKFNGANNQPYKRGRL